VHIFFYKTGKRNLSLDIMSGQGEFEGIWLIDPHTNEQYFREDLLRKKSKLIKGVDITLDWIQLKNKNKALHTGRNIKDRAKEILRRIRKVNPLFQKYLKPDGTPELSGWNTMEKVMNAILDEMWKVDWAEKETEKLKKERKDLLEKLSSPNGQEIEEYVSAMLSGDGEEEEKTDDEEEVLSDDITGDDSTANKRRTTESPSDDSSPPPNSLPSSSTVDDGRENDKLLVVVDDDDQGQSASKTPGGGKMCGLKKKQKLRHKTTAAAESSLDEMNALHVDTANLPPRPQDWIPKDWVSILYFAPTKENIEKKRTLAQIQQYEAHLLMKNDSAKKTKRVDPELGRAAAKEQQQEEASAAKKNTGGSSMNSAAKDPKERIADEFAKSNKLLAQSQDRDTLNQLMGFNQRKIERIMEQQKKYAPNSTEYAALQEKLDALEVRHDDLFAKILSFTSGKDVIDDNDFETPKKQGE
jgi:hypothetical protein